MRKAETINPPFQGEYDVVVIGAGIVGSMIARELSRFEGRFALESTVFVDGLAVILAVFPRMVLLGLRFWS